MRGVPGTYKPTLFISNDNETPLSYQFGTLDLVFQENKDLGKPANEDQEYSILNEITHVYRKPEVRPPSIISLLFSGLVLSPWLFLFYAVFFIIT